MQRRIIEIDESKCNGCGLCAEACHEGAIGMVGGKARLLRDDYCDGLGDCLPACPTGAITFVTREAKAYDEAAVKALKKAAFAAQAGAPREASELRQWPVQIKLAPVTAPYFRGASLLLAADCSAYARAGFHAEFMRGKITLIGCPKLDGMDIEKLTAIISNNNVASVTVARMEVPCCGGIERAARLAVSESGKNIPLDVVTIGVDGSIKE